METCLMFIPALKTYISDNFQGIYVSIELFFVRNVSILG